MLGLNPVRLAVLRQEVLQVVGDNNRCADVHRKRQHVSITMIVAHR